MTKAQRMETHVLCFLFCGAGRQEIACYALPEHAGLCYTISNWANTKEGPLYHDHHLPALSC